MKPDQDQTTSMAGRSTVYTLFRAQARMHPAAPAVEWQGQSWNYAELANLVDRFAGALRRRGVGAGDRIAVLSENRVEYTLLQLAAARIGAIVACLNWRLAAEELRHCVRIADPALLFVSARHTALAAQFDNESRDPTAASPRYCESIPIDDCLGQFSIENPDAAPPMDDPEAGLLLLNTSGTTGLPKAALISHRAEIARMTVLRMDLGIGPEDAYLAWSPMFHMGGSEHTLSSLMFGAQVIITDGLDPEGMVEIIGRVKLGWLLLVPATIEPLLDCLEKVGCQPRGVKVVGCMADLVPPAVIARITTALDAPFLNSFGSTETGLPPITGHLIPVGQVPEDLSKRLSSLCEFRLVDPEDNDVAAGEAGEGVMRGPTLFSGYWGAPDVNRVEFRGGWFHMGDLFRRTQTGGFEFVGRSKYLIKSGGENIYPAEIERVLLSDSRVADAAVVRKRDPKWGEVPVAFIVRTTDELTEFDIESLCRGRLAGYKRPREIHFVRIDDLPRSATGKILREELERRIEGQLDDGSGPAASRPEQSNHARRGNDAK